MATQGGPESLSSNKRKSLTCALCLDIFKIPKLLSCSHTFCQKCLEDLIRGHPQGTFPCPACCKVIEIPAEGASAFQTNFYLDEEELERVRNDGMCSVHSNKTVEMFCVECDFLICTDCKLADHLHHKTQSLRDARKDAEKQLLTDKLRLRKVTENIEEKIKGRATDLKEFTEKKDAVEKKIRDRHAKIISEADKYLKEALESLQEACSETESSLSRDLQAAKNHAETLRALNNKIDTVLEKGERVKLIKLSQKLRTGPGNQQSVQKMEVKPVQHVSRPVHVADLPQDDAMFVSMRNFIGQGQQVTYSHADPGVRVTEQFRCGNYTDSVVFCVCPLQSVVHVSLESSPMDKEPNKQIMLTDGQVISDVEKKGTHSIRFGGSNDGIFIPFSNKQIRSAFVKGCASDTLHHGLTSTGDKAEVFVVEVSTYQPHRSEPTLMYRIDCGPHRAVDINSTKGLLAVVEESGAGSESRQVKLYLFPPQKVVRPLPAADTYQSPLTPCQPADVCFFSLGGQEVLLIADELNDAIHVAEVKDNRLTFSRFLAPGCPLLVQPTALNTDPQGRLWVGCRGGRVLTVEPTRQATAAAVTSAPGTTEHGACDWLFHRTEIKTFWT